MSNEKSVEVKKPESGKAPTVTQSEGLKAAQAFVAQHAKMIQSVVAKHMTPERVFRIAAMSISRNPKLVTACRQSPESLIDALIRITQWGLEVDGRSAHLVPFWNQKISRFEIAPIIDYKGMVTLARRSGEIAAIHADVVCENDEFSFSYGSNAHLNHKPARVNAGDVIWVYSFVRLKDGSDDFSVMSVEECDDIRRESPLGYDREKGEFKGIHAEWPNEMRKKTVFRRHTKWLPISAELIEALATDGDNSEDARFAKAKQAEIKPPNFLGRSATPALPEPAADSLNGNEDEREMQPARAENAQTDDHPPGLEPSKAETVAKGIWNQTVGKEAGIEIPPTPERPPQMKLADIVIAAGSNFDGFMKVMLQLGWVAPGDEGKYDCFEILPEKLAKRCLAAEGSLVKKLKGSEVANV